MILTCDGEVFFATHSIESYLGFHQVSRTAHFKSSEIESIYYNWNTKQSCWNKINDLSWLKKLQITS